MGDIHNSRALWICTLYEWFEQFKNFDFFEFDFVLNRICRAGNTRILEYKKICMSNFNFLE